MPCSSAKDLLSIAGNYSVKKRILVGNMDEWSSRRKAKGKNKKKRWEKLRERRVLGIGTLPSGGLVSDNGPSGNVVTAMGGGMIPGIFNGNPNPPNMPGGLVTKSVSVDYMPRDNDPDVFIDIESARKRAKQIGCIGVSRRLSKGGKTVWMPCTNLTDYNNLVGMTPLGRINQEKKRTSAVRTIVKDELKRRKKSIVEEIYGKALGRTLRAGARTVTQNFDPNAVDGDGDMLVQEGTAFERPSTPSVAPTARPEPELSVGQIEAVRRWYGKLDVDERGQLEGNPIDSLEGPSGLASSRPTSLSKQRVNIPSHITSIDGLDNPEASPTNPLRNLGGKAMSRIIRGFVNPKHRNKKKRTTYIIGGNIGAGKSTVLEKHLVPNGLVPGMEEAATIDPDFIKLGLPGYDDGAGAVRVHGQSQAATDKTIDSAAEDGMDIVLLGAGASRQKQHIRDAKSRGERVIGHFVHVPKEEASRRIRERADRQGRQISDNTGHLARSIPETVAKTINEGSMDEFYLWDNTIKPGDAPKLVASYKSGDLKVYDQKKYDEFMGGYQIGGRRQVGLSSGRSQVLEMGTTTSAQSRAQMQVDIFKTKRGPRQDVKSYETDIEKIVSRAVPTSQKELEQILSDNPFIDNSPEAIKELLEYLRKTNNGQEFDWEEQKKLADALRKTLEESPVLRKLLSITDVPPILRTRQAADNDISVGGFSLFTDQVRPWDVVDGIFHSGKGVILLGPKSTSDKEINYDGRVLSPQYLIRHELGHAIHAMLMRINQSSEDEMIKHIDFETSELKKIEVKLGSIRAKMMASPWQSSQYKTQVDSLIKQLKKWRSLHVSELQAKEISHYAATNIFEYIAESLALLTAPSTEFAVPGGPNRYPPRKSKVDHLEALAKYIGISRSDLQAMLEIEK